jgi:hypothetical protein
MPGKVLWLIMNALIQKLRAAASRVFFENPGGTGRKNARGGKCTLSAHRTASFFVIGMMNYSMMVESMPLKENA